MDFIRSSIAVQVIIGILVLAVAVGYPVYKKVYKEKRELSLWDYIQFGLIALGIVFAFFVFISNRLMEDGSAPDWMRSIRDTIGFLVD